MLTDSCLPVPADKKEEFRKHAAEAAPLFKEFGATRVVEAWGDDVPDGKVTDFKGAVKAKEDEVVVFSWFEYPSKAVRDAANEKMHEAIRAWRRWATSMPFDGKRMIFGGFAPIVDESGEARTAIPTASSSPVPDRQATRPIARWRPRRPPYSRNMARSASSRPGATTCPTARSPTSGAR